jgi:hypothetical protein
MLAMSGRVTMRGRSRWAGTGGSDRTIQRFFHTSLHWCHRQWLLMRQYLLDTAEVVVLRGDDVVVTTAGQTTSGLDRFFASLYGQAVPGLCFLRVSLLSVKRRTSYPVVTEPVEKATEAVAPAQPPPQSGGQRGRPKGSKKRNRREVELSPALRFLQAQSKKWLRQMGEAFKGGYVVFDGELGHNDAMQMVRQVGLHVVSKLRYNSALYCPYTGPYAGRGPRRKYGQKLDYYHMPAADLQATAIDEAIETKSYQMSLWHKKVAEMLNMVVIVKRHVQTHKMAHVVLFSSDLTLGYTQLIDY